MHTAFKHGFRTNVKYAKDPWLMALTQCAAGSCLTKTYEKLECLDSNNTLHTKLSLCLTNHHAMKMYWGSGGVAPRILNLGTRWRQKVSFTLQPLCPRGKSHRYHFVRRLCGPIAVPDAVTKRKNPNPCRPRPLVY